MVKPNRIIHGPVLAELKKLPDESIDMVITSPPYWSLRDYGKTTETLWDEKPGCQHQFGKPLTKRKTGGGPKAQVTYHKNGVGHYTNQSRFCQRCDAWKGQLGLEPTFELYIKHLLDIFSEIKRVLKPTGSCWVNLGDSYGGSAVDVSSADKSRGKTSVLPADISHLPKTARRKDRYDKCMLGLPERFMLGMIERGWLLRNKIIWHKPNHTPTSAKDRLANAWEYLFFFTKAKKCFFDLDAIRQPYKSAGQIIKNNSKNSRHGFTGHPLGKTPDDMQQTKENSEDFWSVTVSHFRGAHFAVFPQKLIEPPIRAGCPEKVCVQCGMPQLDQLRGEIQKVFSCNCNTGFKPGLVLDPFMGSGTTALVAQKLGRYFLGLEINGDYIQLATARLNDRDDQKKKMRKKGKKQSVKSPSKGR